MVCYIFNICSLHLYYFIFSWIIYFDQLANELNNYHVVEKGESLTETPRIRISTIHSAKGAQATNVMLLTDTMRRPYSMWRKLDGYIDDEARVFYVGLTRATERLHLIHPMFSQGYSIPY